MTSRAILLALGSAIIGGCQPKHPDIAYTSERVPYSRSAYERGRADAEADLRAGRLVLEDYGFPREGQQEFADILRQRYGVELHRVASDIVDYTAYGHAFGYNDVSRPEIERRFGAGVIQKAEAEAAEHYRAQHPQ
jgi:hypothetical protein